MRTRSMSSLVVAPLVLVAAACAVTGCSSSSASDHADDSALTSHEAKFVDYQFKGEVLAPAGVAPRQAIITQLFYVEGGLTVHGGNARAGFVRVKEANSEATPDGAQRIKYTVELPVLWPAAIDIPGETKIAFPKNVDQSALDAFNSKYDGHCGKNEYGLETYWHDFDPAANGCNLEDDAVQVTAKVVPSAGALPDLYPEYDLMYADGTLKVVSIFGFDGSGDANDLGVRTFANYLKGVKSLVRGAQVTENATSDSIKKDVSIKGDLNGNQIDVTLIQIAEAQYVGTDFDRRFDEVTAKADYVTYDGHSGLGKNLRALTSRGKVEAGQYQLWFLDGCNSLGYVDSRFTDRRREANQGDTNGTKHVDLIGNALPSRWPTSEPTTFKVLRAISNKSQPQSFSKILEAFPTDQVPAVVGDEDNAFHPPR